MNFERKTGWRNVYVHVPFCASKCGYCAFYSIAPGSVAQKSAYLAELEKRLAGTEFAEPVETLYVGGGTPDFLTAAELERLFGMLRKYVPLAPDAEISCELNPELLTRDKMAILSEFCTRLSVGIQSFDAGVRAKLMRHCNEKQLEAALTLLREQWHGHLNFDLIYGVMGVPWSVLEADLLQCLECKIDHLSCYALTPEENSRLGLAHTPSADDATGADWWLKIGEFLQGEGLARYEISNYARPGAECRHNQSVWRGGSLLGFGPAAAGFDGVDRFQETADLAAWLGGAPLEWDKISPDKRRAEVFAVNLRTATGWTQKSWEAFAPGSWDAWRDRSENAAQQHQEFWRVTENRVALTEQGMLFWDDVAGEILDWRE